MVPQPRAVAATEGGLYSSASAPSLASRSGGTLQCTERSVLAALDCLDACRRMQEASSDLVTALKLAGASLSEWFPSAAAAVATSLASTAAGAPQVSGPPWVSLIDGARTLLVHIAALQAESGGIAGFLVQMAQAQKEFTQELRYMVQTAVPAAQSKEWDHELQRSTSGLGPATFAASPLKVLCDRHLPSAQKPATAPGIPGGMESTLSWSGTLQPAKSMPLKAGQRARLADQGGRGGPRLLRGMQGGNKLAASASKALALEVRAATPGSGVESSAWQDSPLRAQLEDTVSELHSVRSELNETKAELSILRNRCRDKSGPGFYQHPLSLPSVKLQASMTFTEQQLQDSAASVLESVVTCTKLASTAPRGGVSTWSVESQSLRVDHEESQNELRGLRYQAGELERELTRVNRRLSESLEELANMQRVNFDLRALVRELRSQLAVANMSGTGRVLLGTAISPQEVLADARATSKRNLSQTLQSDGAGGRRDSATRRAHSTGKNSHANAGGSEGRGSSPLPLGGESSAPPSRGQSRQQSSQGRQQLSSQGRQQTAPKSPKEPAPEPAPGRSEQQNQPELTVRSVSTKTTFVTAPAEEAPVVHLKSLSANRTSEPATPTLPPGMARQPSIPASAQDIVVRQKSKRLDSKVSLADDRAHHRRSTSKPAAGVPPARVRALWQLAVGYAWRLVKVGRPGMATHQRRAAVAFDELCKTFCADFPDGEMGIYEFISHYAREEEFAMQVQGLMESMKKKDVLQKKDFQTMQAEMTDAYNEAFERVGGQSVAEAHFMKANDSMRALRRARGIGRFRQDVGYEILGLDALYERARHVNPKLMFEVRKMAAQSRGNAICPDLKGRSRARAKVLTKYGNDTACLTDIMRASIVYQTIDELYTALIRFIEEDLTDSRSDFRLLEVTDRFQQPREGYRDVSMLCEVDGVIGEVQLHVQTMILAKKGEGHDKYKKQRVVNEALFEACVRGYEEDVITIMKKYRVSAAGVRDKHGRNALHYACQNGMVITVRLLLKYKANPWLADDEGVLPCELALKAANFNVSDVVLRSMRQSCKENGPVPQGAILRLVKVLAPWWCDFVTNMAKPSEIGFREQWLRMGSQLIGLILQNKAQQPLEEFMHRAAANGETGRVLTFLEVAFDPEPTAKGSVLDHVIEGGHAELARLLSTEPLPGGQRLADFRCVRSPRGIERHLWRSSLFQDVRIAMAALAARADPNRRAALASAKRTPLMLFAAGGEEDMCRLLVECGAQPHAFDKYGCAAVHYARALGQDHVAEYLASLVEVEILETAELNFVEAIQNGSAGAVYRLVKSLSQEQEEGGTPPSLAALSTPMGPYRQTPLHLAVDAAGASGTINDPGAQQIPNDPTGQVCQALVRAGANVMARNSKNETALHSAAAKGHRILYRVLQEAVSMNLGAAELAVMETLDENWSGQTPKTLLERSIVRHGLRKAGETRREDDLLLRVALNAFEQNLITARLDAFGRRLESWREDNAIPMLDLLRRMNPSERLKAWKAAAVREATRVLAQGTASLSGTPTTSPRTEAAAAAAAASAAAAAAAADGGVRAPLDKRNSAKLGLTSDGSPASSSPTSPNGVRGERLGRTSSLQKK